MAKAARRPAAAPGAGPRAAARAAREDSTCGAPARAATGPRAARRRGRAARSSSRSRPGSRSSAVDERSPVAWRHGEAQCERWAQGRRGWLRPQLVAAELLGRWIAARRRRLVRPLVEPLAGQQFVELELERQLRLLPASRRRRWRVLVGVRPDHGDHRHRVPVLLPRRLSGWRSAARALGSGAAVEASAAARSASRAAASEAAAARSAARRAARPRTGEGAAVAAPSARRCRGCCSSARSSSASPSRSSAEARPPLHPPRLAWMA